ncbi:class I SAM-dependent methyltransferase [Mycoplasmatota bacterium]|nr:class I SAM-dependent methyltransferase [Mycoplasmatota bacterium]
MTQNYYNEKSYVFIENTLNVDMSHQYQLFEQYLPTKGKILDLGFGSGRDSLYFSKKYHVLSIDNCKSFVDEAKKILKNPVLLMDVNNMSYEDEFDGIWACASLLHVTYRDLPGTLNKCFNALKIDGIMYMSFKYGTFEGKRKGRHFTDLNEKRLNEILSMTEFKLMEMKITKDVRVNKNDKWLNVIIKKVKGK